MSNYQLIFDIKSDWHIGTGKEAGVYTSAECLKNSEGLPYIPGKSCKGLLREACQLAVDAGCIQQETLNTLFGLENPAGVARQGMLQISNAQLSEAESDHIIAKCATKYLYRIIQSTAIDPTTGIAKYSSLRSIEVAIPMLLTAQLRFNTAHPNYNESFLAESIEKLKAIVTLISEFGNKRRRGLGKVIVSLKKA